MEKKLSREAKKLDEALRKIKAFNEETIEGLSQVLDNIKGKAKPQPQGSFTLQNIPSGQERVIVTDYETLYKAIAAIEQPLRELFNIEVDFSETGAIIATSQWRAELVKRPLKEEAV